jgi:Holliday junction DNA helicase RuvA
MGRREVIAVLRGMLAEKHPNQVVVDVGGVGYDVNIPVSTYTSLPEEGGVVTLRIFTHVREDALLLFGFLTSDEKTIFEKLISVSGIGPTLAIKVLSGLATPDLVAAIRTGDIARLVRIPGVGRKTAERMVLELKDKLMEIGSGGAKQPLRAEPALSPLDQDVLSALTNLGCSPQVAEEAIRKAREKGVEEKFEPLFRAALVLVR